MNLKREPVTTVPNFTPEAIREALSAKGFIVAPDGATAQCPAHDFFDGDTLELRIGLDDTFGEATIECGWGCIPEAILELLEIGLFPDQPQAGEDAEEKWPTPEPFGSDSPTLPLDGLPRVLRDLVNETSEALQVPSDMVLNHALGLLSSAPYGTIRVSVRKGWEVPIQLATMCLAGSGEKKSPTNALLSRPFRELEKARAARDVKAHYERQAKIESMNLQLEAMRSQVSKDQKSGMPVDHSEIERMRQRILQLEDHQFQWSSMIDDATPEYLGVLLGSTFTGAGLMVSDETSIFTHMAGQSKNGAAGVSKAKVYLQATSGDPINTKRLGRSGEQVEKPALSMALMFQPEIFEKIVQSSPELVTSGVVPRMLVVRPETLVGRRLTRTAPVSDDTLEAWAKTVKTIAGAAEEYIESHLHEREKYAEENPEDFVPHEQIPPREMEVSLQAVEMLARYQDKLEPELLPGGRLQPIAAWVNKCQSYVVQIAANLTLVDEPFAVDVSDEYIEVAQRLVDAYIEYQLRMAEVPTETVAERLWIRLREAPSSKFGKDGTIALREIRRLVQNQGWYKNSELRVREQLLSEATDTLISRGYVKKIEGKRSGQYSLKVRPK